MGTLILISSTSQHFQGLRRAQNKSDTDGGALDEFAKQADPTLNPITRRPGPGRGRPKKQREDGVEEEAHDQNGSQSLSIQLSQYHQPHHMQSEAQHYQQHFPQSSLPQPPQLGHQHGLSPYVRHPQRGPQLHADAEPPNQGQQPEEQGQPQSQQPDGTSENRSILEKESPYNDVESLPSAEALRIRSSSNSNHENEDANGLDEDGRPPKRQRFESSDIEHSEDLDQELKQEQDHDQNHIQGQDQEEDQDQEEHEQSIDEDAVLAHVLAAHNGHASDNSYPTE